MMRLRNYHYQGQHKCNSSDIESRLINLDKFADRDNDEKFSSKISSKKISSRYLHDYFIKLMIVTISVFVVVAFNMPPTSIAIDSMPSSKIGGITKPTKKWEKPIIHIINTRFMQEQGNLTILAKARLHLFQTFCLPTIIHQTSQNFIWIIKTDPTLNETVKDELIRLLQPYRNYFLVGSEQDSNGAWRGGVEGEELLSRHEESNGIYTGDVDLIRAARLASERQIILETRLDADDGLHTDYIQFLHDDAVERFSANDSQVAWFYWCIKKNVDWISFQEGDIGRVINVDNPRFCITPGLTVGFNVGTRFEDVPRVGHHKLYDHIKNRKGCGGRDCLQLVIEKNITAIRARTATSAGTKNIILEKERAPNKAIENKIWKRILSPQFTLYQKEYGRRSFTLTRI